MTNFGKVINVYYLQKIISLDKVQNAKFKLIQKKLIQFKLWVQVTGMDTWKSPLNLML